MRVAILFRRVGAENTSTILMLVNDSPIVVLTVKSRGDLASAPTHR
jgi:hypothetical protein